MQLRIYADGRTRIDRPIDQKKFGVEVETVHFNDALLPLLKGQWPTAAMQAHEQREAQVIRDRLIELVGAPWHEVWIEPDLFEIFPPRDGFRRARTLRIIAERVHEVYAEAIPLTARGHDVGVVRIGDQSPVSIVDSDGAKAWGRIEDRAEVPEFADFAGGQRLVHLVRRPSDGPLLPVACGALMTGQSGRRLLIEADPLHEWLRFTFGEEAIVGSLRDAEIDPLR